MRQAINEAVDRAALVRDGLHGRGQPADGPIWPKEWFYAALATPFAYKPESARRRLDAAGLKAKPMPGGAVYGAVLVHVTWSSPATPRFERLALLVQKQLANVGIEMKLLPLPQAEISRRGCATGDFDAFLFEIVGAAR